MRSESITKEFKRQYTEDIKKTVIAFANTEGGEILIGIDDDGTVLGVTDLDETMLKITNAIRDSVHPDVTMFTNCEAQLIENKTIIKVSVQRGTARPYYLASKGIRPEGVFVRQGASSAPASEAVIIGMIKETCGDRYEKARALNQQLTFEKTAAFFKDKGLDFGESQKRSLGFIGVDGTYTNLALLLSEQCPHATKLAVFEGTIKTIFKDRSEIGGSLFDQLEGAYSFIDWHNRTRSEFKGLERVDMRDYPEEAIREALLNALVHRDYSFSGSVLISIFDDRIEFVTIGGLTKGISLEDIELGVSALRNKALADVFYRLKLIEAYGTGITKIKNSYDEYKVKPKLEVTANAFKITLPNTNYKKTENLAYNTPLQLQSKYSEKQKRKDTVLGMLKENQCITRKDIQEALKISQATAILLLREMTDNEMIKKEGAGKLSLYKLNEPK